jgi:hypothetical protein
MTTSLRLSRMRSLSLLPTSPGLGLIIGEVMLSSIISDAREADWRLVSDIDVADIRGREDLVARRVIGVSEVKYTD